MFVVYKVQMPKKTKILLVALFGLGAVACAASMYRLRTLKLYAESKDLTWASIPSALWSMFVTSPDPASRTRLTK